MDESISFASCGNSGRRASASLSTWAHLTFTVALSCPEDSSVGRRNSILCPDGRTFWRPHSLRSRVHRARNGSIERTRNRERDSRKRSDMGRPKQPHPANFSTMSVNPGACKHCRGRQVVFPSRRILNSTPQQRKLVRGAAAAIPPRCVGFYSSVLSNSRRALWLGVRNSTIRDTEVKVEVAPEIETDDSGGEGECKTEMGLVGSGHKLHGPDVKVMGLDVTPELFAISMVYFVQGIVALSRLAMSYFLKDTLMQGPAQIAFLEGFGKFPWLIKPLYGFTSDALPILGYRRRSYLVICGLMSASAWVCLSTSIVSVPGAVLMMVVASLGTACSDVVIDSVVVARSRGAPQATAGSLQSLCWGSAAIGGIASSYYSGYLVENFGPKAVFGIVAVFPLMVSFSSLFVSEDRIDDKMTKEEEGVVAGVRPSQLSSQLLFQLQTLWKAFSDKKIFFPAIFVFLWMATPSPSSAMFFFYTEHLHFQPEFMGRVALVGQVASLGGVGLYNTFLKKIPLKQMFLWTTLLGTVLGLSQLLLVTGANKSLGLSDQLFVLGDSVILEVIGQVSFMPVLVLAARVCPDGVEASLFALLMSILNGGSFTGQALGAGLTQVLGVTSTDFSNLSLLVTICVMSTLLPLGFLQFLPEEKDDQNQEMV